MTEQSEPKVRRYLVTDAPHWLKAVGDTRTRMYQPGDIVEYAGEVGPKMVPVDDDTPQETF